MTALWFWDVGGIRTVRDGQFPTLACCCCGATFAWHGMVPWATCPVCKNKAIWHSQFNPDVGAAFDIKIHAGYVRDDGNHSA
jgi:hypothetical protein